MPRPPRWIRSDIVDGISTINISSWKYFNDFVDQELIDYRSYIFRGHAQDDWPLYSTLDRLLLKRSALKKRGLRGLHLRRFRFATRGRRGINPPVMESDNSWWALGQHHGLASPLLDWTTSPYVAAYFAFIDENTRDDTGFRAIWALYRPSVNDKNKDIIKKTKKRDKPNILDIYLPMSHENPRLVTQGGLFTRIDGMSVEDWVRNKFKGNTENYVLFKMTVPSKDRDLCLRSLNRMNINHLSLFPDLYGASIYCNTDLIIKNY